MKDKHNIEPTLSFIQYKPTRVARYVREKIGQSPNVIEIEMTRDYIVFGNDVEKPINSYKTLAEVIHRHFEIKNDWNTENWKPVTADYTDPLISLRTKENNNV